MQKARVTAAAVQVCRRILRIGCGGWNPFQGGFGSGCVNGQCGGWDGFRGWGSF
jgi:hypothetical protein